MLRAAVSSVMVLQVTSNTKVDALCQLSAQTQSNKQTNGQVPWPEADGTRGQNGLVVLMVMQREEEGREKLKQTDPLWPGRQASKHVASQSSKEDPPPRPSHLQVDGEKTLLLNAGLFSGAPSTHGKAWRKGFIIPDSSYCCRLQFP